MEKTLKEKILEAVTDFAENDGAYSDDSMLEIDRSSESVEIVSEERDPSLDYYDMMDLVEMSADGKGRWQPDMAAIDEISA